MRARSVLVVVSSLVFGLAAACGARTPLDLGESNDDSNVDSSGDDDGGGQGDAHDSSPGADAAPMKPKHVAYVGAIGAGSDGAFALARFYPQTIDPACAYLGAVGTCSLVDCYKNADAPPSDDAGTIRVNVSSTGDGAVLTYVGASPTGTYPTASFASASEVGAGAAIAFVGDGAVDVPAFAVSLTMPAFGALTSPALTGTPTIDSSVDLPLRWGPVDGADAVFTMSPPTSLNMSPTLVCIYDGASGAGLVPSAELAALKQMSPAGDVEASFLAMARTSTIVGDWTVSVIAATGVGATPESGTVSLR